MADSKGSSSSSASPHATGPNATGPNMTVYVAGATGNTGTAAVNHLLKNYPYVNVIAGVRDIEKARSTFTGNSRLTFAQIDVKGDTITGDRFRDATILKGVDTLIVIPPSAQDNRVGMPLAYIDAAKAAAVKHLVLLSAPVATKPDLIFGKEFNIIEKRASESGLLTVTILRAVFFFENQFMNAATIQKDGLFFAPAADGTKPIPFVSVNEVGEALANAAVDLSIKGVHTFTLAGDVRTWDSLAAAYTKALGRPVRFMPTNDLQAVQAMAGFGISERIGRALVELHRDFEKTGRDYSDADLNKWLRRSPEKFESWLDTRIAAFRGSGPVSAPIGKSQTGTGYDKTPSDKARGDSAWAGTAQAGSADKGTSWFGK